MIKGCDFNIVESPRDVGETGPENGGNLGIKSIISVQRNQNQVN